MTAFLQVFSMVFINVLVSFIIFVSFSVFLLSNGIILNPFGLISNPLSVSFSIGAVVGILHGLITSAVIYWYNPDSIIGKGISAIIATEIILFFVILLSLYLNFLKDNISVALGSFYNIGLIVYFGFIWFLLLSVIFIIPSFLIGLLAGKLYEIIF